MSKDPQKSKDSLLRRVTNQDREWGKEPNTRKSEEQVVRVLERSDAERREGNRPR
jgi:hypothetical protein